MSNIINLTNFKSKIEWQQFAEAQFKVIQELQAKNAKLEEQVKHLESLLSAPLHPVQKVVVSAAETLIETQIEKLQVKNLGQEMSLEDVKILDLLLKNKFLLQKEQPKTIETSSLPQLSTEQLISIAETKE
jgi:hypothetical protein